MFSITAWSRLEPRARSTTVDGGVTAAVRDPLWMLLRQWQLGELQGEDAGSPATVDVSGRLGRLRQWGGPDGVLRPLGAGPLEAAALGEERGAADLSLAVELGQFFEAILRGALREDLIAAFRAAFAITPAADPAGSSGAGFRGLVAGRAIDGIALLRAARAARPEPPARPVLAETDRRVVLDALTELEAWLRETVGGFGDADPPTWDAERLDYRLVVEAERPDGGTQRLLARPDRHGALPWYAFDAGDRQPGSVQSEAFFTSVLPANARLRGMPTARYWAFESSTLSLGAIRADRRELGKLVVLELVLVHGNDWYLVPLRQPVGSVATIDSVLVRDVFGGLTLVGRADDGAAPVRWSMFSTRAGEGVAPFFLVPPSAAGTAQRSAPLEDIRCARDELANLAWAIEHVVEDELGEPRARRAIADAALPAPGPLPRYRVHSAAPEHWFPLLPVRVDASRRDVRLELGTQLEADRPAGSPVGRILRPTATDGGPYRIREELLPRAASLRVARVIHRSRLIDGSTHIWTARTVRPGADLEPSSLRFDSLDGAEEP